MQDETPKKTLKIFEVPTYIIKPFNLQIGLTANYPLHMVSYKIHVFHRKTKKN